jgi:APA family basic amino acid/polyamine antiporter
MPAGDAPPRARCAAPVPTPLGLLVGAVAVGGCFYLFTSLPHKTLLWCLAWNAFGLVVYFLYSRSRAVLGRTG